MSEQEQAAFQKTMALAQAALHAAAERERLARVRAASTDDDDDSVHHLRFK